MQFASEQLAQEHDYKMIPKAMLRVLESENEREIGSESLEIKVWHVEYKCIMDVFTLSPWTTQVWAIYVNSIKGSCPKLVTI